MTILPRYLPRYCKIECDVFYCFLLLDCKYTQWATISCCLFIEFENNLAKQLH